MPVATPSITLEWDGVLREGEVYRIYENSTLLAGNITANTHEFSMIDRDDGDYSYYVTKVHVPSGIESEPTEVVTTSIKKPLAPTNLRLTWNV